MSYSLDFATAESNPIDMRALARLHELLLRMVRVLVGTSTAPGPWSVRGVAGLENGPKEPMRPTPSKHADAQPPPRVSAV